VSAALVTTPVLVPLATALLGVLTKERPALQRLLTDAGAFALLACTLALLVEVLTHGTLRTAFGNWPAPYGIELVVDPLGAGMAVITATMGMATLIFARSDADPWPTSPTLLPLTMMLLAGVGGSFCTGDLFNLYVWFELMLVASLGLLAHGGTTRHLEATLKYFVLNALGTILLLISVAYLYGITGHLGFGALRQALATHDAVALTPFVAALVIAFLVKAGAFPVFGWLPASYPTLPAALLALFAGLLTKVGVYAILRVLGGVVPVTTDAVNDALGVVAAATMLFGVLGAAYHWDVRRILSFHIVSQIGYMLLGIALASDAGRAATIFYIVHHIVVKANLFLVGALICRLTGSYDLRRAGGLYAKRPVLALAFLVPALSLIGIPPLSGFWAKLLVLREAFAQDEALLAAVALLVGTLTLYSMMKIWMEAFWKKHPDPDWTPPKDARLGPAYAATFGLAAITLAIGLAPEHLVRFAEHAARLMLEVPR
jgi:multicomponent Na+:H+ antiporter subunit D